MRIRILLLLAFTISLLTLKAQDYKVISVEPLPLDMTAREHIKQDERGRQCAVLRISTQRIAPEERQGFHFDCDYASFAVDRQIVEGEVWVWVSPGMKTLKIKHAQLGNMELHTANYGLTIEPLHVYKVVLQGTMGSIMNMKGPQQQYLAFEVLPQNAILEVNGEQWTLAQGSAQRFLPLGTYSYCVQADGYHSEEKTVVLDESGGTKKLYVDLRPKSGWIEVAGAGNLYDANVYVDDQYFGKAPCKSQALMAGLHNVRIVKEKYDIFDTTLVVAENETTIISSQLKTDFEEITLAVDADAEIWVNDIKKGVRSWTGFLENGTYEIVCKQNGCEDSIDTLTIMDHHANRVVNLPVPQAGYGSLNVESTPNFAAIYIDKKMVGETPMFISDVPIGQHELQLVKENYTEHRQTINVTIGNSTLIQVNLDNRLDVWFECNVKEAQLSVDGNVKGNASGIYELSIGKHEIKVTAFGYRDYIKTIDVGTDNVHFPIGMHATRLDESVNYTAYGVNFCMRFVRGGSFEMGGADVDAIKDEKPVHIVNLDNYYIGETVVTQALWKAVMGETSGKIVGDDIPVVNVSWDDIQSFIQILNKLTGRKFRLPTEAEWEYAARGGIETKGTIYAGSGSIDGVAWYEQNSGNQPHPVKTKQPNELGLYDMSGNVWEWCNDRYGQYSTNVQTNPIGPSNGVQRVLRGGCWRNVKKKCRVSYRNYDVSGNKTYTYGFRLALSE